MAWSVAAFRAAHPGAYDDLSDRELARLLHRRARVDEVRTRWPGAYADLSDAELAQLVEARDVAEAQAAAGPPDVRPGGLVVEAAPRTSAGALQLGAGAPPIVRQETRPAARAWGGEGDVVAAGPRVSTWGGVVPRMAGRAVELGAGLAELRPDVPLRGPGAVGDLPPELQPPTDVPVDLAPVLDVPADPLPGDPEQNPFAALASDPAAGAGWLARRALESAPDMAAALASLPAYAAAYVGDLARRRAAGEGRDRVATRDLLWAGPFGVLAAALGRAGAEAAIGRALRDTGGSLASGAALGAAGEAGTEAVQSGLEHVAVRAATEAGIDLEELATEAGLGALVGATAGGGLGTAAAGLRGEPILAPQVDLGPAVAAAEREAAAATRRAELADVVWDALDDVRPDVLDRIARQEAVAADVEGVEARIEAAQAALVERGASAEEARALADEVVETWIGEAAERLPIVEPEPDPGPVHGWPAVEDPETGMREPQEEIDRRERVEAEAAAVPEQEIEAWAAREAEAERIAAEERRMHRRREEDRRAVRRQEAEAPEQEAAAWAEYEAEVPMPEPPREPRTVARTESPRRPGDPEPPRVKRSGEPYAGEVNARIGARQAGFAPEEIEVVRVGAGYGWRPVEPDPVQVAEEGADDEGGVPEGGVREPDPAERLVAAAEERIREAEAARGPRAPDPEERPGEAEQPAAEPPEVRAEPPSAPAPDARVKRDGTPYRSEQTARIAGRQARVPIERIEVVRVGDGYGWREVPAASAPAPPPAGPTTLPPELADLAPQAAESARVRSATRLGLIDDTGALTERGRRWVERRRGEEGGETPAAEASPPGERDARSEPERPAEAAAQQPRRETPASRGLDALPPEDAEYVRDRLTDVVAIRREVQARGAERGPGFVRARERAEQAALRDAREAAESQGVSIDIDEELASLESSLSDADVRAHHRREMERRERAEEVERRRELAGEGRMLARGQWRRERSGQRGAEDLTRAEVEERLDAAVAQGIIEPGERASTIERMFPEPEGRREAPASPPRLDIGTLEEADAELAARESAARTEPEPGRKPREGDARAVGAAEEAGEAEGMRETETDEDPDILRRATRRVGGEERADVDEGPSRMDRARVMPGLPETASTPDGRSRVEVEYAVVDAADLLASHDAAGRPDPQYPSALQGRPRESAESQAQVREIVSRFDPRLLMASPTTDRGAPIVGEDLVVESGNGRVAAIREIYRRGGEVAERYRQAVRRFEHDGRSVDTAGIAEPVLVRVRRPGTVSSRRAFAEEPNPEGAGLARRGQDLAREDAERMGLERTGNLDRGALEKSFIDSFSVEKRGAVVDDAGRLSKVGRERLDNAVLWAAYRSPELARQSADVADPDSRNLVAAFRSLAPAFAQARYRGARDADVAPVAKAAEEVLRARARGRSVARDLDQGDLLGGTGPDADTTAIALAIEEHIRSRKAIEDLLRQIAADVAQRGAESTEGAMFGSGSVGTRRVVADWRMRRSVRPRQAGLPGMMRTRGDVAAAARRSRGAPVEGRGASDAMREGSARADAAERSGAPTTREEGGREGARPARDAARGAPGPRGRLARGTEQERPIADARELAEPDGKRLKGRDAIIRDFTRRTKTAIYTGRVRGKGRVGFRDRETGVMRIRRANDAEIAAHEIAHTIDANVYGEIVDDADAYRAARAAMFGNPTVREQFESLSYDTSLPQEAVAEAFRYWMTDPDYVRKNAPAVARFMERFERQNSRYGNAVAKAREDLSAWYGAPLVQQLRSKVGPNRESALRRAVAGRTPGEVASRAAWGGRQKFTDDLAHIRRVAGENAYLAARLSRGSAALIDASMKHGGLRWGVDSDGEPVPEIDREAPSLDKIMAKVGRKRLESFFLWAIARRAKMLKEEGRENLLTDAQIEEGLRLGERPENKAVFEEAGADLQTWFRNNLDFAEEAGVIDPEGRKEWERDWYFPFYREVETWSGGRPGPNTRKLIHRLKGGTQNIADPMENLQRNFQVLVETALRNRVRQVVIRDIMAIQGKGAQEFLAKVDGPPMTNEQKAITIDVMEGGKRTYYEVADRGLFESLASLSRPARKGTLRVLNKIRQVIQRAITIGPTFIARNLTRDTMSAGVYSDQRFIPFVDTARGVLAAMKEDSDYLDYIAAGGGIGAVGRDYDETRKRLDDFMRRKGLLRRAMYLPKDLWDLVEAVNHAVELGSRVGEFKKARARGLSKREAAFLGREISVDFALRGTDPTLNFVRETVPFFSAGWAGLDTGYRKLFREGTPMQRAARLTRLALMGVAGTGLYLVNRDNPLYEEEEDWLKKSAWLIYLPNGKRTDKPTSELSYREAAEQFDTYVVPKPFELGSVSTMMEMTAEKLLGRNRKAYLPQMWDVFITNFRLFGLPGAGAPLLEAGVPFTGTTGFNESMFTGRPVQTERDLKKPPALRGSVYTSPSVKALAEATAGLPEGAQLSAPQVEHIFRGYLGAVASGILATSDYVFHRDKGLPMGPGTMPGVRAFRARETRGSEAQTRFWEWYRGIMDTVRTLDEYRDLGREGKVSREEVARREARAGYRGLARNIADRLRDMRRREEAVRKSKWLTRSQKSERIQRLRWERNAMMAQERKRIEGIEKKLEGRGRRR